MADPDAPQRGNERAGPWLHWIQAAFKGNNVDNGNTQGICSIESNIHLNSFFLYYS